jgi:hypothetical protein
MPMKVPVGYPTQLSDDELDSTMTSFVEIAAGRYENFDSSLPELQLALIQCGLVERSRRDAGAAASEAKKAALLVLYVALAALTVSAISLVVALVK